MFTVQVYEYTNRVEPDYNDNDLCDTSFIGSDVLWYQLIPHF
jgi:hypothetical protein